MSKENMDEKFSIVIDINENYEFYKEHAKSNKDEFKNKFVLFYTTWNDAGFYTLLVVRNFYENFNGKIIGTIRICHDDLKIDNNNEKAREIRYFLQNDGSLNEENNIMTRLKDAYISIADSCLYDKLKKILKDDEVVNEFLSRLNEISTIKGDDDNNNERIEKIKSKEWYEKSFIREVENQKIVDFTIYKNDIGIDDNSYYVLKNLFKYFDKIEKNIAGLYKWALNYDLSIEETRQVSYTIKKRKEKVTKNIACEDDVLNKFKNRFAGHTEFIEEIDKIFGINEDFYEAIRTIKEILKVKEDELESFEIGHYTSLETIKILIKKNKDEAAYLRLTNGRQMNDPIHWRGKFY